MQVATFNTNTNINEFKSLLEKNMKEKQSEYYNTILTVDSLDFPNDSIKLKDLIFENNTLIFKQNNTEIEICIDFVELKNNRKIEKENTLSIIEAINFTLFSMTENYIDNLSLNNSLIEELENKEIV